MTAMDSTTLLISWMPPQFEHQNGVIREYRVNITETETGIAYRLFTAATTLTVSSLHPFYTYDCIIAAFTIAEGPYSVEVNITMPEDGMFNISNGYRFCDYLYLILLALYSSQQCSKYTQSHQCVLHLCCVDIGSPSS